MRLNLSPREIEICALHFVDCRPQSLIADWLGLTLNYVKQSLARAIAKQPELLTLRTRTARPRILLMSQLNHEKERGPFNVDEL